MTAYQHMLVSSYITKASNQLKSLLASASLQERWCTLYVFIVASLYLYLFA